MSRSIQAAITKYHRLASLQMADIYFSQCWRLIKSTRLWCWHCLVRALFRVSDFSYPHIVEGAEKSPQSLFYEALIPFLGDLRTS